MNPAMRPPEEEWDPEYTPKSRKYYLVSVFARDAIDRPCPSLRGNYSTDLPCSRNC